MGDYIPAEHRTQWPILVEPLANEPIDSWLARLSYRYGLTPRKILTALGIENQQTPAHMIADLHSRRNEIGRIISTTPPAPHKVRSHDFLHGQDVLRPKASFCPLCLSEFGGWNVAWAEEWAIICTIHHILLVDTCPECAQSQWSSIGWFGRTASTHTCTERLTPNTTADNVKRKVRDSCGFDLTQSPATPCPPELEEAQCTFTEVLRTYLTHPDQQVHFGSWSAVTHRQRAHAFLRLIEFAKQRHPAEERASILTQAGSAFAELSSQAGPGAHFAVLVPDPAHTGVLGPSATARSADLGPIIVASALRTHAELSPQRKLAFRTGRTWPSHPRDWTLQSWTDATLPEHFSVPLAPPAEWIPQQLWSGFSTHTSADDPATRATDALLLLHLGRASRWSHLAVELGLPAHLQHQARARVQFLTNSDWDRTLIELEQLFARLLAHPPPINYRIRRVIAHDPRDFTRHLAGALGSTPDSDLVGHFWEQFTGGDISLAPDSISLDPSTAAYKKFTAQRHTVQTDFNYIFTKTLTSLKGTYGINSKEPLRWNPPP